METFELVTPQSVAEAVSAQARADGAAAVPSVRFIAGGTNLVDYMKLNVERPARLVDISRLPLDRIESTTDGGLRIGALARNSDVATHTRVVSMYPVLSQALLSGASPQLRNMATVGGNLLQRTRCTYFRDTAMACNKREPGSGCAAIGGHNRMLAILGTSEHCIASNPSDQNVALVALDAQLHVEGTQGKRIVRIHEFYRLPGTTPHLETVLTPGDLITHVTLPAPANGARSVYLKLRDRASYEFALASAAVVLKRGAEGAIESISIALGGVGAKPWRAAEAERALLGKAANAQNFQAAANAALREARPQSENAFKVELAKRCLVHALQQASA